jgi:hypothetical protein
MEFSNMTGKNRVVYECMWGSKDNLGMAIEPNSDLNGTTYKIADNGMAIQQAYGISNEETFAKQYKRAISGNGDEIKKILTLHSSSRLALLCFYNVEQKPITLNIEGKDIRFNFSTFEFKNPVIRYPSNMDVVLLSEDRNTVLFLESKFTEYYMSAGNQSAPIGKSYKTQNKYSKPIYARLRELGLKIEDRSDGKFTLKTEDGSLNYLDGIKQMISHYVGVMRRLDGDSLEEDKKTQENKSISEEICSVIEKTGSKVYLGEILFDQLKRPDSYNGDDPTEIYDNYSKLYKKLAGIMNEEIEKIKGKDKFRVLSKDLKYSVVMKNNASQIEKKTLEFYGIELPVYYKQ